MTPDQFDVNVKTKVDSDAIVEYAIKLPEGVKTIKVFICQ